MCFPYLYCMYALYDTSQLSTPNTQRRNSSSIYTQTSPLCLLSRHPLLLLPPDTNAILDLVSQMPLLIHIQIDIFIRNHTLEHIYHTKAASIRIPRSHSTSVWTWREVLLSNPVHLRLGDFIDYYPGRRWNGPSFWWLLIRACPEAGSLLWSDGDKYQGQRIPLPNYDDVLPHQPFWALQITNPIYT